MSAALTLFRLKAETQGLFDGSVQGISIANSKGVRALPNDGGVAISKGLIDVSKHSSLDNLQSFTIEAMVKPTAIGGTRQNIIEGQSPSVAFFIEPSGKLMGTVHTAAGWLGADSGATLMKTGVTTVVTFTRDANGKMTLMIDGKQVGQANVPGPIVNVGALGFRVGAGMDGVAFPFDGTIADLHIRQGVVTQDFFTAKAVEGKRLETLVRQGGLLKNVAVNLMPDASHARLQHVKDIMNAAGVQRISDLGTLPVKQTIQVARGSVIVAPKKSSIKSVDWAKVATTFRAATVEVKKQTLAANLTNRNSAAYLKKVQAVTTPPVTNGGVLGGTPIIRPVTPTITIRNNPVMKLNLPAKNIGEVIRVENNKLNVLDSKLLTTLEAAKPSAWPVLSSAPVQTFALQTVPIDSAVIIAGTLDMTEQRFVVEPNVNTLYIIAENVICGNNAAITWRRPGGSTPGRQNNPDLNGRSWSGIHTKSGSRDGLDGGDGSDAQAGIQGSDGRAAPNIQMWVKNMTGLPNLDFNGEDGIKGGRGQLGGSGGSGADGAGGERIWFFGWHCTADPGDGGNGGDGGRGGNGGRGGKGGNAGKIEIGVLEGTLAGTVVAKNFKLKNQGGRKGRGGDPGSGGAGGRGGRSGNGETCKSAKNGHNGAQGQPGGAGPDGVSDGNDGLVQFFEFTAAAWDDMLTRPWLSQISPTTAFPGDTITLRGSRFTTNDTVRIGPSSLTPTVNPDESISVVVPMTIGGGEQSVFVRRADGTESNRVNLIIKPQLNAIPAGLPPGSPVVITGRAFLAGASVLVNGAANPATFNSATQLTFNMPGTGGTGSSGGSVSVQVRNPDGQVSNSRTASIPSVLEIPFQFGKHNLTFPNFTDGLPDWGTFEDTFGTAEVLHEQLDPVFGHPILTAAFFGFYVHFLKGTANGGLATGFCTSLASLVADRFWQDLPGTTALTKAGVQKMLTGVHGKLLSRESLLHFHDQGVDGVDGVEARYREIEATFLRGSDRQNAPLLFFIPSGEVWDDGYFDKLSSSHCLFPYKFVYPTGRALPTLTPNGSSTIGDPDGVKLFCWDCNNPESPNCRLEFRREGGKIHYDYFPDSATAKFKSTDGITLGMMRHGDYMLADHDLPFSGPFGLTTFVIDFLLSPADLQITDENGLRTGNFGGQLRTEIPGSHLCYLLPKAYMLPANTALTRKVTGTAAGKYTYTSIMPDGGCITLEGVDTQSGHMDELNVSADGTQIRFTPHVNKSFSMTLSRQVGLQSRAISIKGIAAAPGAAMDLTVSPELSIVRLGNRTAATTLEVKALSVNKGAAPVNKLQAGIALPVMNDLAVTVTDWNALDLAVQTVPFE